MGHFAGRLFGPGLAGVGEPVTATWQGDQLRCETPTWSIQSGGPLLLSGAGFNAEQLSVTWVETPGDAGAKYVFFVEMGAARTAFLAGVPAGLTRQAAGARRTQQRVHNRFRWALASMVVVFALPVVFLAGLIWHSDTAIAWLVRQVPPAQEARLGDLVLSQTRAQMKVIDSGPAVDAIRALGERLTPNSVYQYRWLVVDRPDTNALAAPGGVVLVFSGLILKADSPEELAGVLAHEVAHAELRHGLQGMAKRLGIQAVVWLGGDWGTGVLSGLLTDLLDMKFSRQAEIDADEEGLRRLAQAKINPAGMVSFMEKLAAQDVQSQVPTWLSTHPASQDRADQLREAVARLPGPWEPVALDWAAVRRSVRGAAISPK